MLTSSIVSNKRLQVDIARLREMISEDEVKVHWLDGKLQSVDSLTKTWASKTEIVRNDLLISKLINKSFIFQL